MKRVQSFFQNLYSLAYQTKMGNEECEDYEQVAILDAGSQFGKLIDRRLRELNVYSELYPIDVDPSKLRDCHAIIISGGPQSVIAPNSPKVNLGIFELNIPILGICYGMQLIVHIFGGVVASTSDREDGLTDVNFDADSVLFRGLRHTQKVLLTHGDAVLQVPQNFIETSSSRHAITSIEHITKHIYGVQFHPEVDLTACGMKILENFLFKVADLTGDYKLEERMDQDLEDIREKVGDKHVVCLISGGVDSCTMFKMLSRVVKPNKLHAFYVDTGFMRSGETEQVQKALSAFSLKVVSAKDIFLSATTVVDGKETLKLTETCNPEEKRKIIGDTFIKIVEEEIRKLNLPDDFILAQGSLRPDLIESGSHLASTKADVIKTHHNDTQLVRERRNRGLVIEPLKDYHKDEVRDIAKRLGLPDDIVYRQPFPGPGLAIRILCAEKEYWIERHNEIVGELEELCSASEYDNIFPLLLPIRSVGVQGDARSYSYVCALYNFDEKYRNWQKLFSLTRLITNKIREINRIVYFFGVPSQLHIVPTHLNEESVSQLQKADKVVRDSLAMYDRSISQIPVILLPLSLTENGKRCIIIRTMITNDFMTGVPAVPGHTISEEVLNICASLIKKEVSGISLVGYDLTGKPPGTTEWE